MTGGCRFPDLNAATVYIEPVAEADYTTQCYQPEGHLMSDSVSATKDELKAPKFWTPDRLVRSAWIGHIPFAFWLMDVLHPALLVELGVHRGVSYCAFCQAVDRLSLDARCFGIDTWKGDEHAGYYGQEIYDDLREYHDDRYAAFSRLIPSAFDEAVSQFAEKSIDLLHIDGYHTYEAVRHDFETWRPKLSNRAIVLFHDVCVRERNFGVWRVWEELLPTYPNFTFSHSFGLGVLGYGKDVSEPIRGLFAATESPASAEEIRLEFAQLGEALVTRFLRNERSMRLHQPRH